MATENTSTSDINLEMPLSPVLCDKQTRKMLRNKKVHRKSRVKLTKRFIEDVSQSSGTSESSKTSANNTLTVHPLKTDSIEESRFDGFQFKQPDSAVIPKHCKVLDQLEGFVTAGGKNVKLHIPEDKLKQSKKLFDDIFSGENNRINKYAFLSKENCHKGNVNSWTDQIFPNEKENSSNNEVKPDSFVGGFLKASGKNLNIPDSAYQSALKLLPGFELNHVGDKEINDINKVEMKGNKINTETTGFGFQKASGEKLQINDSAYKSAYKLLPTLEPKLFQQSENKTEVQPLLTQETNELFVNFAFPDQTVIEKFEENKRENYIQGFEFVQNGVKPEEHTGGFGFQTASGKGVKIADSAYKTASKLLALNNSENQHKLGLDLSCTQESKELFSHYLTEEERTCFKGFTEDCIQTTKNALEEYMTVVTQFIQNKSIQPNPKNQTNFGGFATAAGNKLHISSSALGKVHQKFKDIAFTPLVNESVEPATNKIDVHSPIKMKNNAFQTAAGSSLKLPQKAIRKANKLFDNSISELSLNDSIFSDSSTLQNICLEDSASNDTLHGRSVNKPQRTKRLGVSVGKQFVIPKHKLEQAARIFCDEKLPVLSPLKTSSSGVFSSTPSKNTFVHIDSDITPIKILKKKDVENVVPLEKIGDRFVVHECTKGNVDSWIENLEKEKRLLEVKLQMILGKQKELEVQKQAQSGHLSDRQKRCNGILYNQKRGVTRIPLQHFLKILPVPLRKLDITPQNANLVHFQHPEHIVTTLDGASIVPNLNNEIGLSEIEVAFRIMPGVDAKLIPEGWIHNHFKWIVWKLASYENFSSNMKNSLTVENVVQQLKYRYDREIDKAERSTLRKIFELDDAPQKRMVLCVSNIFRSDNGRFELELTDGWYGVRTTVDEVLCAQIKKGKVQIGTKLITCGAELINCEGCHPLQRTDMVRLKINSNSTRRTRWYTKLGYQRCLAPFPVKLSSVLPNGGLVGCVKVLIARVYPIKYMERQNNLTIWRNRKAENLHAQEWENKRQQDMAKIRDAIARDYERSQNKTQKLGVNIRDNEIPNIKCPETLFNLCQNTNDPEGLDELLSDSQKKKISDYHQSLSFKKQEEMSRKMRDCIENSQTIKRDVTSVLQIRIVDVLDANKKTHILQIWRPTDTHLEMIKESSVFYVYNIVPKRNGLFSSMNGTRFQIDKNEFEEVNKYKRQLTYLSDLCGFGLHDKPLFCEFDTVGIVVQFFSESFAQGLWLADPSGRLLFVKIFEGPKNCLLLEDLRTGQVVAISNLVYSQTKLQFTGAIANHLTIISSYPQQKYLQEGIDALSSTLPQNLSSFLRECEEKIACCTDETDITKNRRSNSSVSFTNSNSFANSDIFDESLDILFSTIDIDKFE